MNIYQKLIEVRKTADYLKKDNAGFQFKYVSSSQTLLALREKMDEMNLLLVPEITDYKWTKLIEGTNSKGNVTIDILTELKINYMWINADKPEEILTIGWYGQGIDTNGEKGVGKALTYAEKYFLLKFFNIATDKDDPDAHQGKPEATNKPPNSEGNKKTPTEDKIDTTKAQSVYMLAIKKGFDDAKVKDLIKKKYKVESAKDLTLSQFNELMINLDKLPNKEKEITNDGK